MKPSSSDLLSNMSAAKRLLLEKRLRGEKITNSIPPLVRVPRDGDPLPLSYAQQRLWFIDQLAPGRASYNIPGGMRLQGRLDLDALRKSLQEIVQRHESMRTHFAMVRGEPRQVIDDWVELDLPIDDITGMPESEREEEAKRISREEGRRSFDLEQGPLFRVRVVKLSERDHVMLVNMHHIISDGWSSDILLKEFAQLYGAFNSGRTPSLPEPPVQYADYAVWQRSWLKGEALEKKLSYWKRQLEGAETADLPADRPRPAVQGQSGATLIFMLDAGLTESLRDLARSQNSTLYMTLLSALQLLIHRYNHHHDIIVGGPVAGRTQSQIEGLIGLFVNTLAFRTDFSGRPVFTELLARVKKVTLEAFAHQDIPFEKLVDALQLERDLSRSPLFQVAFTLQGAPPLFELGGMKVSSFFVDNGTSKFDLTLLMAEGVSSVESWLEYNTDLFEPASAETMLRHFQMLLQEAVRNPGAPIDELPLLSESERRLLQSGWSGPEIEGITPAAATICEIVDAHAVRSPDAMALVSDGQRISYRGLSARASHIAGRLLALAAGPEARVGVCLDRGADQLAAALGVFKAGMVLVPLESDEAAGRLAYVVADSRLSVLITDDQTQERFLPFPAIHRLSIHEQAGTQPGSPAGNGRAPRVDAQSLACILYRSGPGGNPEGALLQHRALLAAAFGEMTLKADDRIAQSINFAHEINCLGIFHALAAGACSLNLARKPALAPREIVALLNEEEATVLCASAALLERIGRSFPAALKDLRLVICEDDVRLAGRLWALAKPGILDHACAVFGAGEAAGWQLLYRPSHNGAAGLQQVASGSKVHLVDGLLEPAPSCVVGEILVAGEHLALGYEGQPERTAERFLPDPFSGVPGARLYRTGDPGRRRPGGELQLLERRDGRSTIRGLRVEKKEIEAVLLRHPAVKESAVLLREADGLRDQAIEAFVVAADGLPVVSDDLKRYLEERLPQWMLPSGMTIVETIPRTRGGDADIRALARMLEEKKHVGPRNPIEEVLAGIWTRLLNRERVGIHDNFFELGGDSILSVQVISQARAAGLQITPRQMFERQTVAALAEVAVVMEAAEMDADDAVMTGPAPMLPIQQMFFQWRLARPQHFNQALLLQLKPAANSAFLEKAFLALLRHHDALRMRYENGPDGWLQVCEERIPEHVYSRRDFSAVAAPDQPSTLEQDAGKVQGSLDLAAGRLVAAVEYNLGAAGRRLLLVIHHLVVDGVSWRILLEDLEIAYDQLQRSQPVNLGAKTTSVKRWAEGVRQYSESEPALQQLAYWCSDARRNVKPLPRDHEAATDAQNTVDTRQTVTTVLEKEETRELLQDLPGVYHTQINDVLLAALARACRDWTAAPSVLVDVEGHGREDLIARTDVSRTVGWFTTIYPVHLEVRGRWEPGAALKAAKEQLRQTPHHGFGYSALRYVSPDPQVREQLAAMPQAEILFNYLGQLDQVLQGTKLLVPASEGVGGPSASENRRPYPLEVVAVVADGRLQINWGYSDRLHRHETIEQLSRQYVECLRELIEHCRTPEAGGYTPSDFPAAGLRQSDLDQWIGRGENVEDIYSLSPMQQGMLFHSLYESGTGVYFVQMACKVRATMNIRNFRQAWETVIGRHGVLRTEMLWEGLEEPVQIVRAKVEVPWAEEDWRAMEPGEQEQRWQEFLREDRQRGFDLRHAPLMRLMLARISEENYYLAWSTHHILMDGWCLQILLGEVFNYYNGLCDGVEVELERPPLYRDYIVWLRLQKEEKAEAFWREELRGFQAPTRLRIEEPATPPGESEEPYAEITSLLAGDLTEELEELAARHRVTLNTVIQSAWALLLHRYSSDEDVVFGAAVAGRSAPVPGIEKMVGLFINTLPVRVRMQSEETVAAWLQRLQSSQTLAREFEYAPLVRVQGWSEITRGTPLFESLLVFENFPTIAKAGGAVTVRLTAESSQVTERTNYPMTLKILPGKELLLVAIYDRRLFAAAGIERLQRHLRLVLTQMSFSDESRTSQISLLDEAERRQVLTEWNQSPAEYAGTAGRCVHELFVAQAMRTPQAVALEFESRQITYEDLNRHANRIAHYLRALGVGRETRVAVCLERSVELVAGLIGILKAGGAYVPLDPGYPAERLRYMLEDSQATVVLTRHDLLARLPKFSCTVVQLDTQREEIGRHSDEEPGRIAAAENLMYIVYTSGSTGTPKGVAAPHQSMVNRIAWMQQAFPTGQDEFFCQKTSLSFVDSVAEIFAPLIYGVPLLIIPDDLVKDVRQLRGLLESRRVTRIVLAPSLLQALLADGPQTGSRLENLRIAVASGEGLPLELANAFENAMPQTMLLNFYGSSEVAADATYAIVSGRKPFEPVLIGRPLGNVRVFVLDDDLGPLPIGLTGELYVGGAGLARGYINRGDLTAEKFVPDPFSARGGERLYRTGDLARWDQQGNLEYLGRRDYQVKIRGYRIELGEIEAALRALPAMAQAVVVARRTDQQDTLLAAYIVLKEKMTVAALREALRRQLPDYMLPSSFVMLEAMPLTPSGKIDRRALPAPAAGREGEEVSYVAPRTPVEDLLAGVWAEVLRVERVGVHDNFFNLGGHSLIATRVVARIASVLQVELPLRQLFESPTVAGLARAIEHLLQKDGLRKVPALVHRPHERVVPLSYAQQRLWFIEQLSPGGAAYNIPAAVRIRGKLDLPLLKDAIAEVMRRQGSLRTHFEIVESEARQVIDDEVNFDLPLIELDDSDPEAQEAEVRRLALEDARMPFDLSRAPLLRVKILRLSGLHHVLLATMHHVVSDAWSIGILVQEISQVYAALVAGARSSLPDLPVQYTDYSAWQRSWLTGEVLQQELGYWRGQLGGLRKLELPADHPRPPVQTPNGANVDFDASPGLSEKLKDLARREGVTMYMVLLAAFQTLLYRYSRQADVVVGSPIAGRTRSETEGLIGFFVNMLTLRSDLSGSPTFVEMLHRVKETTLDAYAHQDAPFEKLVDELEPERDMSRSPLFQVVFVLQNAPQPEMLLGETRLEVMNIDNGTAKFDLTLGIVEAGAGMNGVLQYNTDLFERSTAARMVQRLLVLLNGAAEDPLQSIEDLPLVSAEERRRLASGWHGELEGPSGVLESSIGFLVREQARTRPQAIALIDDQEEISFAELERRADQVAASLRSLAVRPGERIGICLEGGWQWIAGALGVLRTGAIFVPLEPAEAAPRLAFILQDADVRIVLTDAGLAGHFHSPTVKSLLLEEISSGSVAVPGLQEDPDGPACLLYRSGASGRPQAVSVSHRALCRGMARQLELTPQDRLLQRVDFSRETGCFEIFAALAVGAGVVMVPRQPMPPRLLALLLQNHEVTILWTKAPELELLAQNFPGGLKTVRSILVEDAVRDLAGLRVTLKAQVQQIVHGVFGSGETAGLGMIYALPETDAEMKAIPIRGVTPGGHFYLLDEQLEPVPQDMLGEICVAGDFLASYDRWPEGSALAFVPDPFAIDRGGRLYRTGELGRLRPDGRLELRGRFDRRTMVAGMRVEPREIEAELARYPGVQQAAVVARLSVGARESELAAFVVSEGPNGIGGEELRRFLAGRLPEAMLPILAPVAAIPRDRQGEVDYRALAALREDAGYAKPRNRIEEILCGIWKKLLQRDQIGINDNFFKLGGDSILSIQVITQARAAGVQVTPRQMFERQTIASIAEVAVLAEEETGPEEVLTGPVPLMPIQNAFFGWKLAKPGHFNQAVMLAVKQDVDSLLLERSLMEAIGRHDSLRMKYEQQGEAWLQSCEEGIPAGAYRRMNLSELQVSQQNAELSCDADETQAGLDLAAGRLLSAVEYDFGGGRGRRLLLVIHHLAVDGVSWRVLLEDMELAYRQLRDGETVNLGRRTASVRRWADAARAYSETEPVRREAEYWCSPSRRDAGKLTRDYAMSTAEDNTVATLQNVTVFLDAEETRELLQQVPQVYHTQINDALLAALGRAFGEWSGSSQVLVDLEGHGREDVLGIDVSRTMGWFTTVYPVVLDRGPEQRWEPGRQLKAAKERLRGIPSHGLGYNALRYAGNDPEIQRRLSEMPQSEIIFNYLGQLDQVLQASGLFLPSQEGSGRVNAPENRRPYLIDVNAAVAGGQLQVSWSYSEKLHRRETIERVAHRYLECLRQIIVHCRDEQAGGYTPSDFPLARLDQQEMDLSIGRGEGVEDVYGLTPMQEGMLFHSRLEAGSAVYAIQMHCNIHGALDIPAFRRAWQDVVARHAVLRTSFRWEGLKAPVQVVQQSASLPWHEEDWRDLPPEEQQSRWAAFLEEDRRRGLDYRNAPLMRVALVRTADQSCFFAWDFGHILMDGWCVQIVMGDVFRLYETYRRGQEAAIPGPPLFRDYIAWMQQQDEQKAEMFWRAELKDFRAPTRLRIGRDLVQENGHEEYRQIKKLLHRDTTAALDELARKNQVTMNTVAQGAWAILLSRYSGEGDVVFGATVAGRSASVPGIESMVGIFINTLPVRAQVRAEETVAAYLSRLQARQAAVRDFEYPPLVKVQGWSDVPPATPLFDSILVFENFPLDAALQQKTESSIELEGVKLYSVTNYPLSLRIIPGKELSLDLTYRTRIYDDKSAERLVGHLAVLLEQIASGAGKPVGQLSLLLEEDRRQFIDDWNEEDPDEAIH